MIETIDTAITVEWPGQRTIGTLVEMSGQRAVLLAMRAPPRSIEVTFRVEGDTEEEAVMLDGVCEAADPTDSGEVQVEVRLLRVGTTCSSSRLRDFIETWSLTRGGSVHIGQAREGAGPKRFVYHIPERGDRRPSMSGAAIPATLRRGDSESARPRPATALPGDLPDAVSERASRVRTSPEGANLPFERSGRRPPRPTVPATLDAANVVAGTLGWDDDDELPINARGESTLNTDVGSDLLGGAGLDDAFRAALEAVEAPRLPRNARPTVADGRRGGVSAHALAQALYEDHEPDDLLLDASAGVRPTLRDDDVPSWAVPTARAVPGAASAASARRDEDDEDDDDALEPTQMLSAVGDDTPQMAFETGTLSAADASQVIDRVNHAIAREREVTDAESFDFDEPIVVNTVRWDVPFADPVQLGREGVVEAAALWEEALAEPAHVPPPAVAAAIPEPPTGRPTGRLNKPTVLDALSLPLRRPEPLAPAPAADAGDIDLDEAHGMDAEVARPITREPSEALKRVAEIFAVDVAVRCELEVQVQIGRKREPAVVVRLAESKLRLRSQSEPKPYQRVTVLLPAPDGAKKPFELQCEITRIRERGEDAGPVSYDMRVVAGNSPKQMAQLRALIQTFHAPTAGPASAG